MSQFPQLTTETAPEAAKPLLETSLKKKGRIPGLHAVMANAPGLLARYDFAGQQFLASTLTAKEKTVVWQTINVEQNCHYCVPAPTAVAKMMKVEDAITERCTTRPHCPPPS